MKYKEAVKICIDEFNNDDKSLFVGYNIKYGDKAMGIFSDVDEKKLIETPVAENLMMGLATGLSISGYKPMVYYERFDFIMNAMDALVNHLDKIREISKNQFRPKVIIRVVVGGKKKPFFTGHCHTQDFTESMKKLLTFPVLKPKTPKEVIDCYNFAFQYDDSVMIIEEKDFYDIDD